MRIRELLWTGTLALTVLGSCLTTAQASDGSDDLRVESYVLPVGAAKPSLEELRSGQGLERLRELAGQSEPGVGLAAETVWPAEVPGQTAKDPLHRTVSAARIDKNRAAAVKQCKRYWGADYTNGGQKECDEYPLASTYEGAAENYYDPDVTQFNFSAKPIPKDDNQAGGLILKSFYAKNRIIDGLDDGFIVKIAGWSRTCTR